MLLCGARTVNAVLCIANAVSVQMCAELEQVSGAYTIVRSYRFCGAIEPVSGAYGLQEALGGVSSWDNQLENPTEVFLWIPDPDQPHRHKTMSSRTVS